MSAVLLADQVPAPPQPPRPGRRFTRSIDFAALPTAISCTRLFVASTLHLWGAQSLHPDAELLAVALVRHSVHACGVIDANVRLYELDHVSLIHVRLVGFDRSIGIAVWDTVTEPADLHGLGLVDARATDWGSSITPQGRVTWAELAVYERTQAGLPRRTRKPSPRPRSASSWPMPQHDLDFLARVRHGIAGL